jgi:hypothetical protein
VAESQIIGMRLPADEAEDALLQFEVAMLARGTNSLKAIATLCGVERDVLRGARIEDKH